MSLHTTEEFRSVDAEIARFAGRDRTVPRIFAGIHPTPRGLLREQRTGRALAQSPPALSATSRSSSRLLATPPSHRLVMARRARDRRSMLTSSPILMRLRAWSKSRRRPCHLHRRWRAEELHPADPGHRPRFTSSHPSVDMPTLSSTPPMPLTGGGLSGCTFEEAISWGKEAPESLRVQCFCDATIALAYCRVSTHRERRPSGPPAENRRIATLCTAPSRSLCSFSPHSPPFVPSRALLRAAGDHIPRSLKLR